MILIFSPLGMVYDHKNQRASQPLTSSPKPTHIATKFFEKKVTRIGPIIPKYLCLKTPLVATLYPLHYSLALRG
jgi:hypothetical protein